MYTPTGNGTNLSVKKKKKPQKYDLMTDVMLLRNSAICSFWNNTDCLVHSRLHQIDLSRFLEIKKSGFVNGLL